METEREGVADSKLWRRTGRPVQIDIYAPSMARVASCPLQY